MVSTSDLGKLCKREHDHADTGMSMRYIHKSGKPIGNCVVCGRENGNKDRDRQIKVRRMKALDQGRFDEKYRGNPCQDGHVLRYVVDGSCVSCDTERRRALAAPPEKREKRALTRTDNTARSRERAKARSKREAMRDV